MKDQPHIAPEIRGLLEEIAADPRSDLRLVPRKPLRAWFERGESAPTSAIATTRAERHLVEEHRESLAALLCEAAWIAYWKAPFLNHRPVGEDGRVYTPTEREPVWRKTASRFLGLRSGGEGDIQLLLDCLSVLPAERAYALSRASLALVPCDRTRCYVALTVPLGQPRSAIHLFRHLSERAHSRVLRSQALLCLSWRLCNNGQIPEALEHYRRHTTMESESIYGRAYALNLACYLGDLPAAQAEADELARIVEARDPRLLDLSDVVATWARSKNAGELALWHATYSRIAGAGEAVARMIGGR